MDIKQTKRGFDISNFCDRNGQKCSLQKSSIATEDCIWLGVDEADIQILVPGAGWQKVRRNCNSRMHLTQGQVQELLPYLQHFAIHGEIGKSKKTYEEEKAEVAKTRIKELKEQLAPIVAKLFNISPDDLER